MKTKSLSYRAFPGHERGTILRLLRESYQDFSQTNERLVEQWDNDWRQYDDDVFDFPETVGASGFITYQGEILIGFASWDPRVFPTAIVGHNCILPAYRRNGLVKRQIEEMLKRLAYRGFTKARATTGDHPGFVAARRLYLACGFRKIDRRPSQADAGFSLLVFERDL